MFFMPSSRPHFSIPLVSVARLIGPQHIVEVPAWLTVGTLGAGWAVPLLLTGFSHQQLAMVGSCSETWNCRP